MNKRENLQDVEAERESRRHLTTHTALNGPKLLKAAPPLQIANAVQTQVESVGGGKSV